LPIIIPLINVRLNREDNFSKRLTERMRFNLDFGLCARRIGDTKFGISKWKLVVTQREEGKRSPVLPDKKRQAGMRISKIQNIFSTVNSKTRETFKKTMLRVRDSTPG